MFETILAMIHKVISPDSPADIRILRFDPQMPKCKAVCDVLQIQEFSVVEDPGTYGRSPLCVICKTAGQEMECTYNWCHDNQDENVTLRTLWEVIFVPVYADTLRKLPVLQFPQASQPIHVVSCDVK